MRSLPNFSEIKNLLTRLENLPVTVELIENILMRTMLNKIKLQAAMPLCSEQIISVLLNILSLRHDHGAPLSQIIGVEHVAIINTFVEALRHLIKIENNNELHAQFHPLLNDFSTGKINEKRFCAEFKELTESYVSCVDMDFVMNAAEDARKSKATAHKHAILLLGKTGAGKSYLMNYLGEEKMFSSPLFKDKSTLNIEKQPSFLKHIKINSGVVSETSVMGIVNVDDFQSKGMAKFRGLKLVVTDTPGFGDNRSNIGPELKLANSLETIAPIYKAQTVRFLVLLGARATTSRGADFAETIKFVAKMFADVNAVRLATHSMVFAISGNEAKKNYPEFVAQIAEFRQQQKARGFDEKDMELINVIETQLAEKQVLIIQPGVSGSARPSEIMQTLIDCPTTDPKVLCTFAEEDIGYKLNAELTFVANSINRILNLLTTDASLEVKLAQISRLTMQFAKFSFMDSYYSVNHSPILPYFVKLADTLVALEQSIISTLCQNDEMIKAADIAKAKDNLTLLSNLDAMNRFLITGLFGENRSHIISFIQSIDKNCAPPDNYLTCDEFTWKVWCGNNCPANSADNVEEAVKRYRLAQVKRLTDLMNVMLEEMLPELVTQLTELRTPKMVNIAQVKTSPLNNEHPVVISYCEQVLQHIPNDLIVQGTPMDETLSALATLFSKNLTELRASFGVDASTYITCLKTVIHNLATQKSHYPELFGHGEVEFATIDKLNYNKDSNLTSSSFLYDSDDEEPSLISVTPSDPSARTKKPTKATNSTDDSVDPYSINILDNEFARINETLIEFTSGAIDKHNFVTAVDAMDKMGRLQILFNKQSPQEINDVAELLVQLTERLIPLADKTDKTLSRSPEEFFTEEEIQALMLDMLTIQTITNHSMLKQNVAAELSALLNSKWSHLNTLQKTRFDQLTSQISDIMAQDYTSERFTALGPLLQQLWYSLSLPGENRDNFIADYAKTVSSVKQFSTQLVFEFNGHLQSNYTLETAIYQHIESLICALKQAEWIDVLELRQLENSLHENLADRATLLIEKINAIDLNLGNGDNLYNNMTLVNEIKLFSRLFDGKLDPSIIEGMSTALQQFYDRAAATVQKISSTIANRDAATEGLLPLEALKQYTDYIARCRDGNLFEEEITNTQQSISDYLMQCAEIDKLAVMGYLKNMQPSVSEEDFALEPMKIKLELYTALQSEHPLFYAACGNPLAIWVDGLQQLQIDYTETLKQSLKAATTGDYGLHEQMLDRVESLIVLDSHIEQHHQRPELATTFSGLHLRFVGAFKKECFPLLKAVMDTVYARDFKSTQTLVNENPIFAPDSELHPVLTEQIGHYISACVSKLEKLTAELNAQTSAKPACMPELMEAYQCIESAQSLVEAGLLSASLLKKREHLLRDTSKALENWLIGLQTKIMGALQHLDFKSAQPDFENCQKTLQSMARKPNNHESIVEGIHAFFTDQLTLCQQQFQEPLMKWANNPYSVAQVATSFTAMGTQIVDSLTYSTTWEKISACIYDKIDKQCEEIELQITAATEFDVGHIVRKLDMLGFIALDIPADPTDLMLRIRERYVKTTEQIEIHNINHSEGEARLDNIKKLLDCSDKIAKSLGGHQYKHINEYLLETAKNLKTSILHAFDNGSIANEHLLVFADLHYKFSKYFSFFDQDKAQYTSILTKVINHNVESIDEAKLQYGAGNDQAAALQTINDSLNQLVAVQLLSKETQKLASMVDPDLPRHIVRLLQQFKHLLYANNDKFQAALTGRKVSDLSSPLTVAQEFHAVTLTIVRFINASNKSPLPDDYLKLKQLNTYCSSRELCVKLLNVIKQIGKEIDELNPKSLQHEGRKVRLQFYADLKRNIEFLQNMPSLTDMINPDLLKDRGIKADYGLAPCLTKVTSFITQIFHLANTQLSKAATPSVSSDWTNFNYYYQELTLFVEQCANSDALSQLSLEKKNLEGNPIDGDIETPQIAKYLADHFTRYLDNVVATFKNDYFTDPVPADRDKSLVSILAGLQKMAEDMPVLADDIKTVINTFLKDIQQHCGVDYISVLQANLRKEEKGFGASLVSEQPVFAGLMTAERNQLTFSQDIHYVLTHMQIRDEKTEVIRNLTKDESEALLALYNEFEGQYDAIIQEHTSLDKDFAKSPDTYLELLRNKLLTEVNTLKPEKDNDGHIIWNSRITQCIPSLYATIFAIWTLKSSPAYFDLTNTDACQSFLKKPHPAQMVAIFQMLNCLDADNKGLHNNLSEVLTGEGKSVVLSATASLLSLIGYAVDLGCYSEYLSSRDANSFAWLFEFLEIKDFVQYGTFNRLSEDMLNQRGDLRDLMRNALFDSKIAINKTADHGRQTIALVDEVDSLVTAFFGRMYQPYFLLQSDEVDRLLDAIWTHHTNGTMKELRDLLNLPEYTACLELHPACEYLLKNATIEMFNDLHRYKQEDGHDFHVSDTKDIYYKHFDGTTMSKSIGYQTYWACRDGAYGVSEACRKKHQGIKITCGAFSYADLMRDSSRYSAMLGVTGTYRELSKEEMGVVKDVFGIKGGSFIPSAYGTNQLAFNKKQHVMVVPDDQHASSLCKVISNFRQGKIDKDTLRPVLVFFDTEDELDTFYNAKQFEPYRAQRASKMNSKTITTTDERDSLISKATRAGQITLAVKDHGRGSDFILTDPKVIANGGMAVIDAFMPETEADQRQHQGRAARQGQDGSFAMVLKESEITQKFKLTKDDIDTARDEDKLYETLSEARNARFAKQYQLLIDDTEEMLNTLHKPSISLLDTVRNANSKKDDIIAAHEPTLTRGVDVIVNKEAKVLILFDSSGSMDNLIAALKTTLSNVVSCLGDVLQESGCTFQLQIAHYKDYHQREHALTTTQGWSCNPEQLNQFISQAVADGGGGNNSECVELGLYYANQLVEDGLNHVILIGDEPPSSAEEIDSLRKHYTHPEGINTAFNKAKHYIAEANALHVAKVPVSTYFVATDTCKGIIAHGMFKTKYDFGKIAEITNGESGELKLDNPIAAAKEVTNLFATKIINTAAAGDNNLAKTMLSRFQERIQSFTR